MENRKINKKKEIGDKFGKLTIIQLNVRRTESHPYHLCLCECGNFCERRADSLKPYSTCGCDKKYIQVGEKYGLLTVIEPYIYNDGKHSWHKCKCDCGNIKNVRSDHLKNGNISSCGCMKSFGELYIKNFFNSQKINYKQQYTYEDLKGLKGGLLKFDFAVIFNEKVKLLIEYNGKQHYEPIIQFGGEEKYIIQQKHDDLKAAYCKKNNIPLLIIPYWDFNNIENLILEKLKEVN